MFWVGAYRDRDGGGRQARGLRLHDDRGGMVAIHHRGGAVTTHVGVDITQQLRACMHSVTRVGFNSVIPIASASWSNTIKKTRPPAHTTTHLSLGRGANATLGGLDESAHEAVVRGARDVGAVHCDVRTAVVCRLRVREGESPQKLSGKIHHSEDNSPYQCRWKTRIHSPKCDHHPTSRRR